jgi:N4-gp56 family major capsid protein
MAITNTTTLALGFLPKYWDKKIGENLRPSLYLYDFGEKRRIPLGTGKTILIPRILKRTSGVITTSVTEGTAPALCALSSQLISGTLKQFTGAYKHSDVIAMTALSDVVQLAIKEIGYDLAREMDTHTFNQISANGLKIYGNGKATSNLVLIADTIRAKDIIKATVQLDSAQNPRFPGTNCYAGYMHPKLKYDIFTATSSTFAGWVDVMRYSENSVERIFNGEVGKFWGVKFVESTKQKASTGPLCITTASTAYTWIFAPESYYVTELEGLGAPQTFVKQLGSAGAADPVNQYGSVGAKCFFTAIPVNYTSTEYRMVRILSSRSL